MALKQEFSGIGIYDKDIGLYLPESLNIKSMSPGDVTGGSLALTIGIDNTPVEGRNVVDVGTNTGIGAIYSVLKGARLAYALEIDPDKVRNAKENAIQNGVYPKVVPLEADVFDIVGAGDYEDVQYGAMADWENVFEENEENKPDVIFSNPDQRFWDGHEKHFTGKRSDNDEDGFGFPRAIVEYSHELGIVPKQYGFVVASWNYELVEPFSQEYDFEVSPLEISAVRVPVSQLAHFDRDTMDTIKGIEESNGIDRLFVGPKGDYINARQAAQQDPNLERILLEFKFFSFIPRS
jgi:hypothetical protein